MLPLHIPLSRAKPSAWAELPKDAKVSGRAPAFHVGTLFGIPGHEESPHAGEPAAPELYWKAVT